MRSSDAEFLQQLRATFRIEAQEHLQAIAAGLVQLEQAPAGEQPALVETVFRAAHSLKGAAGAVELPDIERVCQGLEDTFAAWKRQASAPAPDTLDGLHALLDRLAALLALPAPAVPLPVRAATPTAASRAGETVRVSVALLDARLTEAEEMLTVKLAARQRVDDLRTLQRRLRASHEPDQRQGLERQVAAFARAAEQDGEAIGKLVDELVANAKQLLLLPFASIASGLPKLVRDLCRAQGKEAQLEIAGEHIALDKRVLDALRDPLIHMLRNCVDHGIELPAERLRRGKPARARIRLAVAPVAGGKVRVTLADDGIGIDTAKVKATAVKQGLLAAADAGALSEADALALIFRSGFTTSPLLTDLSGRGLGLPIVQENAARLGGEVTVDSQPGAGTTFRIVVPAMRATFRGVLLEVAGRALVLPTMQVERVLRLRREDLRQVEGRATCTLDGRVLPVATLARVLELPGAERAVAGALQLVILGRGEERVAFAVDQVVDEQEFLVKPLAPPLSRVRNVASAAILPSGRIAFILNVADLLLSARRATAGAWPPAAPAPAGAARSILVAEDSITSRMLLQAVLESAGYRVTTALDGLDALGRLRAGQFDLVVSDVEMPRLDGFELTARIRADRRLADTPVVLVTALESREHRERGVDVGANAYIVKSSFEQGSLLDAVRRLV
jgi:two-component system chemotaxis sensor kinase CheA